MLLLLERLGVRKLEAFFGTLVAIMTVSFGVMYFKAECPTDEVVVGTILPRIRCDTPLLHLWTPSGITRATLCIYT